MSERSDLLVDAAELDAILRGEAGLAAGAPRTRVLDIRSSLTGPPGYEQYLEGHIPGAVYADLETELSEHGPATLGRHPLPGAATLTAAARRWGLNPGDSVIAYDGGGNLFSARIWWQLRDAGFANVRLLDGALPAWIAAGLPLEVGEGVAPEPGTITLEPGRLPRIPFEAVADFARANLLLDARAAERYAGESEAIDPQAGHIPGAWSLPTTGNVDENGFFLSPEELRARFASVGIDASGTADGRPVGAYCGSGVTAVHTLFALALAGYDGVLYPGSWSQWSNHPGLPVATGAAP